MPDPYDWQDDADIRSRRLRRRDRFAGLLLLAVLAVAVVAFVLTVTGAI